jgi:hypothetical protein
MRLAWMLRTLSKFPPGLAEVEARKGFLFQHDNLFASLRQRVGGAASARTAAGIGRIFACQFPFGFSVPVIRLGGSI